MNDNRGDTTKISVLGPVAENVVYEEARMRVRTSSLGLMLESYKTKVPKWVIGELGGAWLPQGNHGGDASTG